MGGQRELRKGGEKQSAARKEPENPHLIKKVPVTHPQPSKRWPVQQRLHKATAKLARNKTGHKTETTGTATVSWAPVFRQVPPDPKSQQRQAEHMPGVDSRAILNSPFPPKHSVQTGRADRIKGLRSQLWLQQRLWLIHPEGQA